MLLKELHILINSFDVFCNSIGHTALLSFDLIIERRNYLVQQIAKLVNYENGHLFENNHDEIQYFKNERPKFLMYSIYYERILNMELEKPIGKERKYYKTLQKELCKNSFLIMEELKYYRLGSLEKDNLWFIGNSEKSVVFAKALEMVEKYLNTKLGNRLIEEKVSDSNRLKWTGTQAEYVEELTSWKETKVINNGDVTLKEIHERFQLVFEVNITDFNSTSHEIMLRHEPARFCNKKAKAIKDKQKRLQDRL